jgi:hypothetical protein
MRPHHRELEAAAADEADAETAAVTSDPLRWVSFRTWRAGARDLPAGAACGEGNPGRWGWQRVLSRLAQALQDVFWSANALAASGAVHIRRPSRQRDSDGTDGAHPGATGRVLECKLALATSGADGTPPPQATLKPRPFDRMGLPLHRQVRLEDRFQHELGGGPRVDCDGLSGL